MATTSYIFRAASPESLISDVASLADASGTAVAANAAGTRYFGAWAGPQGEAEVEGRLINRDGSPASGLISISQPALRDQLDVSLARLAGGGFVATYTDRPVNNLNSADIRARLFTADGLPGSFLEIAVDPVATFGSDVAALADGGFAVTWTRLQANDFDVLMSVHNADGSVRHAADAVNVNLAHDAFGTIAGLAGGGFVVAWEQSNEIRYRRFDANGSALDGTDAIGVLIDASGGLKTDVRVAGLPDGGFVVAYQDGNWGTQLGITAVVFDPDGTQRSALLHVNAFANGGSPETLAREPTLTVLPNGYFVVGWIDGHAAQHLQAYDAVGNALGHNAIVATQVLTGDIAALQGGLIADVWGRPGTGGHSIHSQVLELARTITGNDSDETIGGFGDGIAEIIDGKGGNDTLKGGGGHDTIEGGGGEDTALFTHSLDHYLLNDLGSHIVVEGAEGRDRVHGVEHLKFADGAITVAEDGTAVFDSYYYLSRNADVFHAGVNPLDHFNSFGRHEGRDPNAFFDTSGYLAVNQDVAAGGINPLEHYHRLGWQEGRDPSAAFDTTLYLIHNPDVAALDVDPLAHFMQFGRAEGRTAHRAVGDMVNGFDAQHYLFHNPDVAAAGVDPRAHFDAFGWHEGRNPNGLFDAAGYLAHYADVAAAGVNPLEHYNTFGWKEGRDPSAGFDTLGYLALNPDVAAANVNPLDHYLMFGIYEGRQIVNDGIWH
jgi:hypothetical protein